MRTFTQILVQLAILFFSIIIHEVSHGYAALRSGDPTAKLSGRLTLNPLRHIDPFGTLILPILLIILRSPFLIGWAKPVPINPYNLRNPRIDMAKIGAAGPLSNLGLAIVFSIIFRLIGTGILSNLLIIGAYLNILLFIFNLIPIPPLDGSRIIGAFLPYDMYERYMRLERFGFIIIFALVFLVFDFTIFPLVGLLVRLLTGI